MAASVGTIIGASNTNTATESICPKGWRLPTLAQIYHNVDVTTFSPTLGGNYGGSILYNDSDRGFWWGSDAFNGVRRYNLRYDGKALSIDDGGSRNLGRYIRCVSEEKDVQDLTYMQDMTPSIAANTAKG